MAGMLIVQNSPTAPEGEIGTALRESGIRYQVVRAGRDPLPDARGHDAVIVLGGGQHAADDARHPYLAQEKEMLRRAVRRGQPCLGICLGGQILAHAMGADIIRGTGMHFGFRPVRLTEEGRRDPLFTGVPSEQRMFQWHSDRFGLPPGAQPLARADEGSPEQAFRVGRRGYGVQFHVEVSAELLRAWLNAAADAPPGEAVAHEVVAEAERDALTYYPTYRRHVRTLIANFAALAGT